MYNRYIPQSDGSYRRNQLPEQQIPHSSPPVPPSQTPPPQENHPACTPPPPPPPAEHSAPFTLKNLLPQGLDVGDLLVVALLLLMAGDCEENKNTMLLTLALYLFL